MFKSLRNPIKPKQNFSTNKITISFRRSPREGSNFPTCILGQCVRSRNDDCDALYPVESGRVSRIAIGKSFRKLDCNRLESAQGGHAR